MNEIVVVRLKWGQTEYKGRLVSIDSYMNIQLSDAAEYLDQELSSQLGSVLIRYATFYISFKRRSSPGDAATSR